MNHWTNRRERTRIGFSHPKINTFIDFSTPEKHQLPQTCINRLKSYRRSLSRLKNHKRLLRDQKGKTYTGYCKFRALYLPDTLDATLKNGLMSSLTDCHIARSFFFIFPNFQLPTTTTVAFNYMQLPICISWQAHFILSLEIDRKEKTYSLN